jgi:hypothetical protein
MSDAGFVTSGLVLPRGVLAAWRQEERAEAAEARQAATELAERCESRRSRDLAWAARMASDRGEVTDPVSVAAGRVTPRPVADVLAEASARADYEFARADTEARRTGEKLVLVGELEDPSSRSQPMSATAREMARQRALFAAAVESKRAAEAADSALRQRMPSLGPAYTRRESRRSASGGQGYQGLRSRDGGWVTGVW